MIDLGDTLNSLQATDAAIARLSGLVRGDRPDLILHANLEALAKRRRDLETRLGAQLSSQQLDLVEYRIETADGTPCPALAIARALQSFQELTTAVFDAIRSTPKRRYEPSTRSAELSTLLFSAAGAGPVKISLSVPNDRLIAIRSDLDLAFELVFAVLRLRSRDELAELHERTGTSALTRAYGLALNSAEHGLDTFISWRKSSTVSESIELHRHDAVALMRTIESTRLEETSEVELECQLIGLDQAASSFVLHLPTGQDIGGLLRNGFPRGAWTIHASYIAALTQRVRVHCSTGEETTRWTLNRLIPHT